MLSSAASAQAVDKLDHYDRVEDQRDDLTRV